MSAQDNMPPVPATRAHACPRTVLAALAFVLAATELATAQGATNLVANPEFDDGLTHWLGQPSPNGVAEAVVMDGRTTAHLHVPTQDDVSWPNIVQSLDVTPGDILECTVKARAVGARDGYGTYAAMDFFDGTGQRITFEQSRGLAGTSEWQDLRFRAVAPTGSVSMDVSLLLHGHGDAYFDAVTLSWLGNANTKPPDGPVVLTVSDTVVTDSLIGFGFEDDGWFYNNENASHGVTESDAVVREERIAWMDPDWVRMFFWYHDWNPSEDWETFTFGSENMESHYRTLDLYQRIGAKVNVTSVEWGMTAPYADLEPVANAIGALLEHLIVTKGYSCIQYWTLSNEPNLAFPSQGNDFDGFVSIHQLVRQTFAARGLAVKIVGSDDAQDASWFSDCVSNASYHATVDLYASHRYFPDGSQWLIPYFYGDRLPLLAARSPRRPFVVGEYGFQDNRSTHLVNPLMEEYPYAVWAMDFCIQGLNLGMSGASIWCLHEVYYPGNGFMNYGLWNYKDRDWEVRPVYHAVASLCRHTEPGEAVLGCDSSHPAYAKGTVVGDTLFWVNPSTTAVDVRLSGFRTDEVRIYTERSLDGDRETGYATALDEKDGFFAPPMSFGYAEAAWHSADTDRDGRIGTEELLRVIQLYGAGELHCEPESDDGYAPGAGNQACTPHDGDYRGAAPDWKIELAELLRIVQLANGSGYVPCTDGEDGFCPTSSSN